MTSPRDARDNGRTLRSFQGETLLVCPRCAGCCVSRPLADRTDDPFVPRRLRCMSCGLSRDWSSGAVGKPGGEYAIDDHFHLPFWLQARCRHGVVWACNASHLDALTAWIEAPLRSRRRDARTGWSNGSLFSRLPAWMKSARHRKSVGRALKELRARLPESAKRLTRHE